MFSFVENLLLRNPTNRKLSCCSEIIIRTKSKYHKRKNGYGFFNVPAQDLAKNLLGKALVRKTGEHLLKGIIVETEAYLGAEDLASHSSRFKKGERLSLSHLPPGSCAFTSVYGIHTVFSISSSGEGACVLLRAVEPIAGIEWMIRNRNLGSGENNMKRFKPHRLCSGPAKLCAAFNLKSVLNGYNLAERSNKELFITKSVYGTIGEKDIVECPRVGLAKEKVGSWADSYLRYYILGHSSVSKKNKHCETELLITSGILEKNGKFYLK